MTRIPYLGTLSGSLGAAGIAEAQEAQAARAPAGAAPELSAFGLKADGVTDDTGAIQKALDAAAKGGGTVRLPAAKYLVAGALLSRPESAWKAFTMPP